MVNFDGTPLFLNVRQKLWDLAVANDLYDAVTNILALFKSSEKQ